MSEAASPSIYIVVVLYNQLPVASPAVSSLFESLCASSVQPEQFHLLLYDNSPKASTALPSHPRLLYFHDARNQGLAVAYNYALQRASEVGCSWLLLLDQDTTVTVEYLREALELAASLVDNPQVSAIVPKLRCDVGIKSPTLDFLESLRRQFQFPRKRKLYAETTLYGLQREQWSAFNSASLLRVSALARVGGFPEEFWLDFLDIATFFALHEDGGRIFVMQTTLKHELSLDTRVFYEQESGLRRYKNVLSAMILFVRKHGRRRDLWLTRFWLLRRALTLMRGARDKRFAAANLWQACCLCPTPRDSSR
jgi:GT2 family glycosyltransferase